jgi:hypothetical protein
MFIQDFGLGKTAVVDPDVVDQAVEVVPYGWLPSIPESSSRFPSLN